MLETFALAAAHASPPCGRLRSALDGAVTGLSPYITHGFVLLTVALPGVAARDSPDMQHKFVFELRGVAEEWRTDTVSVWKCLISRAITFRDQLNISDSEFQPMTAHWGQPYPAAVEALRSIRRTHSARH